MKTEQAKTFVTKMAPLKKMTRLTELKILHYNKQDMLYALSKEERRAFRCRTLKELRAINVTGEDAGDTLQDGKHLLN